MRSAAIRLGTRVVHIQVAPVHVSSVQRRERPGCFRIICNFLETEAAGFARDAICQHIDAHNFTKQIEDRPQLAFSRLETHLADKLILRPILS